VNEHVLVVEDDPSIREVTTLGLEQAGFQVTSSGDGREGLVRFRQGSFDLVLLDVMLPSLDGFEVLREIRHDNQTPVVMLTARSDLHDVVVGLELGADDYVTKPFELPELVARIKAVLRRSTAEPGDGCCSSSRSGRNRCSRASCCSSSSGTTTTSATPGSSTQPSNACGQKSRTTRRSRS